MDSTAVAPLELDQEARMQIAIKLLEANPDQSVRQLAKSYDLPQSTLNHRWKGRRSCKESHQAQQKLSVFKEDSIVKWINTMGIWGWPPRIQHLESMAKDLLKAKKCSTELGQH